jgi:hypothetical protein
MEKEEYSQPIGSPTHVSTLSTSTGQTGHLFGDRACADSGQPIAFCEAELRFLLLFLEKEEDN